MPEYIWVLAQSTVATSGFIPAKSFSGSKAGYAFKAGPQGTGYYLDNVSHVSPFLGLQAETETHIMRTRVH